MMSIKSGYLNKKKVLKFKYQEIFHSTRIKIKNNSIDTCAKYDKLNMLLRTTKDVNKRHNIQSQLDAHQKEASDANNVKHFGKNSALEDSSRSIYTIDLQQYPQTCKHE